MAKRQAASAPKLHQKKQRLSKFGGDKLGKPRVNSAEIALVDDLVGHGQPGEPQATQLDNSQLQTAQRHTLFMALQQNVGHAVVQQMVLDKEPQARPAVQKKEQLQELGATHSTPNPVIQLLRARGLVSKEVREIRKKMAWFKKQLTRLEEERAITTEEGDHWRSKIEDALTETKNVSVVRNTSRAEARQLWLDGRRLLRNARKVREIRNGLRQYAERGRSTKGLRLISNFQITPPVIRVQQGEAARLSFVLNKPAEAIYWYMMEFEGGEEVPPAMREFNVNDKDPGYKYAMWDGTWPGSRNQPPQPGNYRVHLVVKDKAGHRESVFDQIRVENPDTETVLPRAGSGLALKSLEFDGTNAVLTDAGGNQIRARAISGLKPHHHRNKSRIDYTQPRYQAEQNLGPIPEGTYIIHGKKVQHPTISRGKLQYPSGGAGQAWGPFRAELQPDSGTDAKGRSEFFLHLDVTSDGTAGCIGIQPSDEGKFNQIMSLISLSGADLPVTVHYPQKGP